MRYDTGFKANYLSIPNLNQFVSYMGSQFIVDAVAWWRSKGFAGFMTFALEYEYVPDQRGYARYPLSTLIHNRVFGIPSRAHQSPSGL